MDLETLRQHLAEDERVALAAGGDSPNWHQRDPEREHGRIEDDAGEVVTYDESAPTPHQAEHIVRHDPAWVLRWVRAAREILAEHEPETVLISEQEGSETVCTKCLAEDWPCPTVLSLMSVYGDTDG
jgi:hypothetical protein